MPELPDVEIFNRLVLAHCRGRSITQTLVRDSGILQGISAEALAGRLNGEQIRSSQRYGKHLFILLRAGVLTMHFGTNGSLQLVGRGQSGPPYTRLALNFDDGDVLAYINPRRLGGVGLRDSMRALIAELALGPDVADPAFDLGAFIAILGASKRDIKAVLMDQRLMAGLGNIYSDEVLFQARIHPDTAASSLRAADAARLFTAMRETLRRAVERGAGSETGLDRLPADFLLPRRRRGGRCPRCGTTLATAKHGGRTSYYCPRCQPK